MPSSLDPIKTCVSCVKKQLLIPARSARDFAEKVAIANLVVLPLGSGTEAIGFDKQPLLDRMATVSEGLMSRCVSLTIIDAFLERQPMSDIF